MLLDVNEHRVDAGDLYLMCSDGLSDMIRDDQIAEILLSSSLLHEKAQQLVAAANNKGGRDNISVLLAFASDDSGKKSLLSRILGK